MHATLISIRRSLFGLLALSALFAAGCGGSNPEPPKNASTPAPASQPSAPPPSTSAPAPSTTAPDPTAPAPSATAPAPGATAKSGTGKIAVLQTSAGAVKIELLPGEAPKTVENFRRLSQRGLYNGTIFHRVISGFMIQGGDPRGDGTGGQTADGKPLPNEINRSSQLYQGGYKRGLVAMANRGTPETGTSQFFIMHQNYPLAANYTVFGRVIEGMDVVDKIATAPTAGERPRSPVTVKQVVLQ